ncbi:MAG: hypothetical protein U1F23_00425 [Lysobacterales bacterium]
MIRNILAVLIMATVVIALAASLRVHVTSIWRAAFGDDSRACRIKGNVSVDGQRIYHVPGSTFYAETRIDVLRGERWFCTEAEAQAAGWRKSAAPE